MSTVNPFDTRGAFDYEDPSEDLPTTCKHMLGSVGICDGCLEDLADGCTEDEGNRTDQIDGHTTAHFAMLAMTGQCPWCGAESEVEFSSKVTP